MNNKKIWRLLSLVTALCTADALHAASCEYSIRTEWNSGFTASISITNDTSETIDGWAVSWGFSDGSTVAQIWNASLSGASPYVASNLSYNGQIAPSATVEFGFNGNKGQFNTPAQIPVLSGVCDNTVTNQQPVAVAEASPNQGEVPFDVTFDGTNSSDPDGDTLTYRWEFANGDISTDAVFTTTFDQAGSFPVTLIVNDGEFDSAPVSLTIVAEDPPLNLPPTASASGSPLQGTVPFNVTFDASDSSDPNGDALSYRWDFGNGDISTEVVFTRTFDQPGIFPVTLTVNDGEFESDPVTLTVVAESAPVNLPPSANAIASPIQGSVPFDVTFDASESSDPNGDTLTYRWDFGGGDIATGVTVTRTFDQPGEFPVSLTVNDGEFDSDATSLTILASDNPGSVAYSLDATRSSLHFVSTKQTNIIETHRFEALSGSILDTGEATLVIDLDSIESGIDIRNERMRNFLFETAIFSEATVSLSVDMDDLASQAVGSSVTQNITANIDLHGVDALVSATVIVTKLSASSIIVQSATPIIIQAGDFDLTAGIDALREIAGLAAISYTVPANFTLFFNTP